MKKPTMKPMAPKPRPKQPVVSRVIDVSPKAEAGDQFFVQQAMKRKKKK
jgi:hypothetical protein